MRAIFKDDILVLVPETDDERTLSALFGEVHEGDVFELVRSGEHALALQNLGPRAEACREPINITSEIANPEWIPIGNFAHAPFTLDGRTYASTEGFWQGLKFPRDADRRRIAALFGHAAKKAGEDAAEPATLSYEGVEIQYGRPEHWQLMRRACEAKFTQDDTALAALLSTGTRPLTHRMRRDSRSIPGAMMSQIWMDIRAKLRGERDAP
jgi:predicted NAD-dependent protein-ADP-ribosyltransferase YbiA (DUF1768 family)